MAELQHTNVLRECQPSLIRELAQHSDNEYYLSALGLPQGNKERAERGRARILQHLEKLKSIQKELTCSACRIEIDIQIKAHVEAIREIESVWKISS